MAKYILALDQGTTSSRSVLFTHDGAIQAIAQQEFPQLYPAPGHVEHDPEAIWHSQLATARSVLQQAAATPEDIAAIGIANQRETVVLWERATGKPVHNAIVWQSRITARMCERMKQDGIEPLIRAKTGLLLDAYFSASKIKYLLDQDSALRKRAEKGEIVAGTIDCYLLWRLTGGKVLATDYSNASRTLLFNIFTLDWDDELLRIFTVPRVMLPSVKPSSGLLGATDPALFGKPIPISGLAGDQQAAVFGQNCFTPGMVKNTYGTGCFLLMNTGERAVPSMRGLLTTIGWGIEGKVTYCLEGAIFIAGAAVQWLRDGLGLIAQSSEIEELAATEPDSGGVYFVPAFVGLGAPYWDPYARGVMVGLTRGTTRGHIARATLEAMGFQTRDVIEAMEADAGVTLSTLKVDGGAAINNTLMQFQADILGRQVERPVVHETTALGAAYLAGLAVGFWDGIEAIRTRWALDRAFAPQMPEPERERRYRLWQKAVSRAREWEEQG